MKSRGFGYRHYTISAWESEEDLKIFSRKGVHLEAMKRSPSLASEIRTYTYPAARFPQWSEAKMLLYEKGKVLKWVNG